MAAGITRAEPDGNTYAEGYAVLCNDDSCSNWEVEVDYAVTYNGTNVWINGYPSCYKGGTYITWCGYGNNGQKTIGIGANFGNSGQYKFRIYVSGDGGCSYDPTLGVTVEALCA